MVESDTMVEGGKKSGKFDQVIEGILSKKCFLELRVLGAPNTNPPTRTVRV